MQIATWNVNSLKVRLPHLLDWLRNNPVDILCLQETKLTDDKFPLQIIKDAGYHCVYTGQKTYNGVAILSKSAPSQVHKGIDGYDDEQQRVIAATIEGIRIICAYVPNGQAVDSDKYSYKLNWLDALTNWIRQEMMAHPKLALLGDYNIAPDDRDVHDPNAWIGQILVSEKERTAFAKLISLGLVDAFRLFEQAERIFSWWDYRQLGFQLNKGMRIDHILLSSPLATLCSHCLIDKNPRKLPQPSDHTPVIATLAL